MAAQGSVQQPTNPQQQRMIRPMSNNPGLRHLLQQVSDYSEFF